MASLCHILMLLLLLFTQLQEIGTGSESRCDCVISLIYNGTLSEVSWTLSKQLCNAENEGYIIKTPRSQNSSEPEDILFCTCKSGRPYCRVEPAYNYSIAKNIITLTLNTSDEGKPFSFEKLPSNEKCHCTFQFSAQVPYMPEEDATTPTTVNPHQATTPTTSSITPTQDASSETNMWAVIAALAGLVVVLPVAITMHLRKQLKDKAKCNKNKKDHVAVTITDEVQRRSTEKEVTVAENNICFGNVVSQDSLVPLHAAVLKQNDGYCVHVASSSAVPEPQGYLTEDDESDPEDNELLTHVKPRDDEWVDDQHTQEIQA